jgi:hypothetical protein
VPDSTFRRLVEGSTEYQQVFAVQRRGLWTRPLRVASYVNPPVRIFVRSDVVPALNVPPRIELPSPWEDPESDQ